MGSRRELKFALESYWKGSSNEQNLLAVAAQLRHDHWKLQQAVGIDLIPSNDFSLYDQALDSLVLIGATPARFGNRVRTLSDYFAMARCIANQSPTQKRFLFRPMQ